MERVLPPKRIEIVQERDRLWRFTVMDKFENVLDTSLASRRSLVWGMSKRSWRRANKKYKRHLRR